MSETLTCSYCNKSVTADVDHALECEECQRQLGLIE